MRMLVKVLLLAWVSFGAYAEPQNLMLLRQEVIAYHDSGAYEKEFGLVVDEAKSFIHAKAINNQHSSNPKRLALVLDIDETSLSNYPKMVKRDFVANRTVLHEETMAANAPVLPAMLALYQQAQKDGIAIFFVTGRHLDEREATIKNLHEQGFKDFTALYLRPDDYTASSIIPFKSGIRKLITEKGYHIIATIGDQRSDLEGGYADKGFKLPNPYYYLP